MRKKCLLFLLCMITTVAVFAGKESLYTFYEGFEEGIPATWTQEYNSGQVSWVSEESGASLYPASAFEGNGLVALRNTTGQTQKFKTMLVTPVMDITEITQPILVFSHAQMQYAGDVDVLCVYYRTSADSRWVEIGTYASRTKGWQTDTIELTAPTATYQIAFEGVDQMGRGIALDEVIVRPTPTCTEPTNVTVDGLTSNAATLRWNGSLDTDSFNVVLSANQLTDMAQLDDVIKNEFVYSFDWSVKGLERKTLYWVYIQAYCGGAVSEWTEFTFQTKNLENVPYTESFDKPYAQNTMSHVDYWTHGTSLLDENGDMTFMPCINNGAKQNNWRYLSPTTPATTALAFVKSFDNTPHDDIPVPAGQYVYAATPELNVESVSSLKATFWGIVHNFFCDRFMSGLIVGVMTDPADFTTFVPVDTVYVNEYRTHKRFTVHFNNYTGEGKYIAFASNFQEKDNGFYMDELVIEDATIKDVTDPVISNCLGARFDVNANLNGNQQVQLIVARDTTDTKLGSIFLDPTKLPADYILENKTLSANDLPYTVQLKEGGKLVQVYMRAVAGGNYGQFTLPIKVLVPMQFKEDIYINFDEPKTSPNVWTGEKVKNYVKDANDYPFPFSIVSTPQDSSSLTPQYPYVYLGVETDTSTGHNSRGRVQMAKQNLSDNPDAVYICSYDQKIGDYIALPEVDDLKSVYLSFYMKAYEKHNSRVAVGVMSDPYDPTTFDTLRLYEEKNQEWVRFVTTFDTYKGKGKFPAIMTVDADEVNGVYVSNQYIDDIVLATKPSCMEPTNVECENTHNEATITWEANGMTEWVVSLYADAAATQKVATATVNTPTCTFTDIKQHTTYYYGVSTKCNDELTTADIRKFTTTCAPYEPLPYIEDFESWQGNTYNEIAEPICWTMNRLMTSYGNYPFVNNSGYYQRNGKAFFAFHAHSASKPTEDLYVAMPMMEDDLNKLQIKFYARVDQTGVEAKVYVGIMSNPDSLASFDTIAECPVTSTDYANYIVPLKNYQGAGKHIALMRPQSEATKGVYIDDIMVDYLPVCENIFNVEALNATPKTADILWQKGEATQWEVLLTTEAMTLGTNVTVDGTKIVALEKTTTMPYQFTTLSANQQYYVYVRAVCSEDAKGYWSDPAEFKTPCAAISAGDLGLIDFSNEDALDCWTVGVREGTTADPTRNANGYLYMFNSTKSEGAYAIMPAMDVDSISRLQVSFDAHGGTGAQYLRKLTVGIITDPADLSTFSKITTVDLNQVSSTAAPAYGFDDAKRYTVRFDEYIGDMNGKYGKYIMFISENGTTNNYIYIDNIRVDTIAACMELLDVKMVKAEHNALTIGWENIGNKYQVQLLNEDKTTIVADTIVADTAAVTLAGLTPLTIYCAQVRQICAEGDTSRWSFPVAMQTACPLAYTLPYSEYFDTYKSAAGSYPNCWEIFTSSTSTSASATPCVYASAKKEGKNGFLLYRNASHYTYAVLPNYELDANQLMLTMYYRNVNTSSYKAYFVVGVATDITSKAGIDSTLTVIDSVEVQAYKAPNDKWYYYNKSFAEYTGTGGNIVLIAPKADKSANSGAIYIDNVYVEKASNCLRPEDLAARKATSSSISISWNAKGEETAWDVAYVAEGGNIADATIVPVSADSVVIEGLQHSTNYDFYVRANCGGTEVSNWTNPITANTLYVVELADANWNFDDAAKYVQSPYSTAATYKLDQGWMVGNTKNSAANYTPYNVKNTATDRYAKSDSCALKIYSYVNYSSSATSGGTFNNGAYAIMPEINADYDDLQIRFSARGINTACTEGVDSKYETLSVTPGLIHAIKIGTLTDPYDLSTFDMLKEQRLEVVSDLNTLVDGAHWEEVVVSLYGAKGKYIAFVADFDTASIVYIDDLVVEKETVCATPTKVSLDAVAYNKATFSWLSGKSQWQVQIKEVDTDIVVDQAVVSEPTWTTTKLEGNTRYQLAVSAVCDDAETSEPVFCTFQTPCVPVDNYKDYVYDFESNLYQTYEGQEKYLLPDCWQQGKLTEYVIPRPNYSSTIVYNEANYQYSRNRNEEDNTQAAALKLHNYVKSYTDSYVILPEMNFDLEKLNLHFWARAAAFMTPTHTTYPNRLKEKTNNYQRSIVIGAVADIEDVKNTFVPLDTFTYSQSWNALEVYAQDDPTGNNYWEEVIVPLKDYAGKGRVMILYPSNGTTSGKTSYFYIDDLEIVNSDVCMPATNLQATNLTANSATLTWVIAGNDRVRLQVATDKNFADSTIILNRIVEDAAGRYQVSNLNSGTAYYFRVQHLCAANDIADWKSATFTTLYDVRFVERFSEMKTYPTNWGRANGDVLEVFAGNKQPNIIDESVTAANWRRTTNCIFASAAMRTRTASVISTGATSDWLLSPIIDLTKLPKDTTVMLSLQLGLSSDDGYDQMPKQPKEGDKFLVAVSEDGGKTWNADNTTWWSDAAADNAQFSYAEIPLMGKLYAVDFSKYIGKQIQVAFISYTKETNTGNYIYLANVSINGTKISNYTATSCEWVDYVDENFVLDAYDVKPGEITVYESYVQAKKATEADKYSTMTLNVLNSVTTTIDATICEGESYTLYNFNIPNATASGVYKQKLQGVNTCDSIVVLNLTVNPTLRQEVTESICQGDYYEFNGVKYYTSIIHSDTLTSQVTDCDSIVTLYLTVNEILTGEEEVHLCPDEFVEFGKFGKITEAGTYVDTIKNALLCDSAATLYVYLHANATATVRGAICQGESYSQDVWNGLTQAGDYPSEQETVWGCDSIVTLHLMVADANKTIYDNITSADLPYVLNGEELLPVGTTDGTYTKLIDLSCGTITAVITVGQVTDVNSVYQNSLALAPNLVTVGQETKVYGSFDEDAVLEVYHTTGALVYRSANTNVVPGLPTAGVYMVTVKSNNQVFQSMLIVQ